MKKKLLFLFLACVFTLTLCSAGASEEPFRDKRFRGRYTTANIQAILDAYDLRDGWYWVSQARTPQTFRGEADTPGWTETTKTVMGGAFQPTPGWYGCRWNLDEINPNAPNADGWGECFGFAQFIGYLLSGDRNPHGHWVAYTSIYDAGGLRPGDIVRVCYDGENGARQHSAVVYEVLDDQAVFIQVCGANYNMLSIRHGFFGAGLDTMNLYTISRAPGLRIYRSPENAE